MKGVGVCLQPRPPISVRPSCRRAARPSTQRSPPSSQLGASPTSTAGITRRSSRASLVILRAFLAENEVSAQAYESSGQPSAAPAIATGLEVASFRTLSEDDRRAIVAIMEAKMRLQLAQAQVREDTKVVADRLGMKPAELNRIVRLAARERERGNVLAHEKALIEVAEQVVF